MLSIHSWKRRKRGRGQNGTPLWKTRSRMMDSRKVKLLQGERKAWVQCQCGEFCVEWMGRFWEGRLWVTDEEFNLESTYFWGGSLLQNSTFNLYFCSWSIICLQWKFQRFWVEVYPPLPPALCSLPTPRIWVLGCVPPTIFECCLIAQVK